MSYPKCAAISISLMAFLMSFGCNECGQLDSKLSVFKTPVIKVMDLEFEKTNFYSGIDVKQLFSKTNRLDASENGKSYSFGAVHISENTNSMWLGYCGGNVFFWKHCYFKLKTTNSITEMFGGRPRM